MLNEYTECIDNFDKLVQLPTEHIGAKELFLQTSSFVRTGLIYLAHESKIERPVLRQNELIDLPTVEQDINDVDVDELYDWVQKGEHLRGLSPEQKPKSRKKVTPENIVRQEKNLQRKVLWDKLLEKVKSGQVKTLKIFVDNFLNLHENEDYVLILKVIFNK